MGLVKKRYPNITIMVSTHHGDAARERAKWKENNWAKKEWGGARMGAEWESSPVSVTAQQSLSIVKENDY